ncbi:hypothetical protein [Neobacillus sp. 114]|uniref:hypothetical protein n=1 Tax=Neobacillus sp. 114 TaxID=3048535 RepID=UPI0024C4039A|nr:hypothetical protein [Neobacillus sp. 114]
MLRNTWLIFCLLYIVPLSTACSKTESPVTKELNLQKPPQTFAIPSEYTHAKDMLDSLTKEGIEIKEIRSSNHSALFQTKLNYSMLIKSESGDFTLIHLGNKNGKDYTIVKMEENGRRFIYSIRKNGEPEQIYDTNAETYFNINEEYITITQSKDLNKKLKKVLNTGKS